MALPGRSRELTVVVAVVAVWTAATPVLAQTGAASGTVTSVGTSIPVPNARPWFCPVSGAACLPGPLTAAPGTYTVSLPTGGYVPYVLTTGNHVSELYGGIMCPGVCTAGFAIANGTAIQITNGGTTPNVDFHLTPAAGISGRVRNAVTSAALPGVTLWAYASTNGTVVPFGGTQTDASGNYAILGLPSGSYYVATATATAVNEVYDNGACPGPCDLNEVPSLGRRVLATAGQPTTGIDFDLDPGGMITGVIRDAITSAPVATIIGLYRPGNGTAIRVTNAFSDASGMFAVGGLPSGTYFAVFLGSLPYAVELFGGIHCYPCASGELLSGTPIVVTSGATTANVDFALDRVGTLSGTVSRNAGGTAIASAIVGVLRDGSSEPLYHGSQTGSFAVAVPAGTYRVFTNTGQFTNKVYDDIACPGGDCATAFAGANGVPVTVGAGGTIGGLDFHLDPLFAAPGRPSALAARTTAGGIEFTWQAPTTGGAAVSYVFEGGVTPGGTIGSLPAAGTSLVVPGVPPGTYYLRVRAVNPFGTSASSVELTMVVGAGGVVAPDPPVNLAAWTAGGRLNMTWSAPAGGPAPTGYVIEAGTAAGLANLATLPVTARSFTVEPVPPGFYFLRVRSSLSGLVSVPTSDVMITVGNVPAPPSPPRAFVVTVSGSLVTMTWQPAIFGPVTGYVIEAGSAAGLSNLAVFNTGSTATNLAIPGVPAGTYYLRLRAVNGAGASAVSTERGVTVK
ncbi:MAG: carboxypeptidase regulatory-like domain-containing protein [Vicinamibacterales bacterium]